MNFLTLHYFVKIAEELSFTKAAEKIHISQQALTTHMKKLEEELDVKLFNRKKGITLTYAGLLLNNYAHEVLQLENKIRKEMKRLNQVEQGRINLAINETRAYSLLPVIMDRFYKDYPYVELSIIEGDIGTMQTAIAQDADFIVGANINCIGTTVDHILADKMCLLVPKNFVNERILSYLDSAGAEPPKAFTDMLLFRDMPFVMLKKDMPIRMWADKYLANEKIFPKISLETTGIRTMFSMVEKGLGVSFCQESLLYSFRAQLESKNCSIWVFPVESKLTPEINLGFVYKSEKTLSKYARYLISVIRDFYAQHSVVYESGVVKFEER